MTWPSSAAATKRLAYPRRRSGDVLPAAAGLRAVLPLAAALASAWRLGKLAAGPTCPTCQPQLRTAPAAPRLGASSFLDRQPGIGRWLGLPLLAGATMPCRASCANLLTTLDPDILPLLSPSSRRIGVRVLHAPLVGFSSVPSTPHPRLTPYPRHRAIGPRLYVVCSRCRGLPPRDHCEAVRNLVLIFKGSAEYAEFKDSPFEFISSNGTDHSIGRTDHFNDEGAMEFRYFYTVAGPRGRITQNIKSNPKMPGSLKLNAGTPQFVGPAYHGRDYGCVAEPGRKWHEVARDGALQQLRWSLTMGGLVGSHGKSVALGFKEVPCLTV